MMQHFKTPDGRVFGFDSDQLGLVTGDMIELSGPELAALINPPPPLVVPQSVSPRQARLALLGAGLLASVDAAINALPEPTKSAARIEWEYATEIDRNSPLVSVLAQALSLDATALDALFTAAGAL